MSQSCRRHWCLALYIHLLLETCGPLKGALHRSLWTTGQKQARDLLARLYLRKFCFVVLATQPRAVHFKPASHVDCRITAPPPHRVPHRIKWGGWKSAGDSALALCNFMRSQAAHVPITAEDGIKSRVISTNALCCYSPLQTDNLLIWLLSFVPLPWRFVANENAEERIVVLASGTSC